MTCSGGQCEVQLRSDNRTGLCQDCYHRAYRLANRLHLLEKQRAYRDSDVARYLFQTARKRAKANGMEFDLVVEDIVIPTHCPLLGVELHMGTSANHDASPSLDRVDSTKGYVAGNVRVVSHKANRMKNNATADQLQTFALNVLAIHGSGELMGDFLGEIDSIDCPRCAHSGPHDRAGAGIGGAYVVASCRGCELEWRVAG